MNVHDAIIGSLDDAISASQDINKAFDLMHEGKSIRSVIEF